MCAQQSSVRGSRAGTWIRRACVAGFGAAALLGLGGCYGSYSYTYSDYGYVPCEPVVVHRPYCAPAPVVVIDHHYHGSYYGGHYRGGHSHHGGHSYGGSRGRRW